MLRIRRTPTTFYPRRSVIFFKTSSNTPVHLFCIAWIIIIIYISYMSFIFICHEIHVNCSKNHILEFTINWTFYQYNIWNVRKFEWKFTRIFYGNSPKINDPRKYQIYAGMVKLLYFLSKISQIFDEKTYRKFIIMFKGMWALVHICCDPIFEIYVNLTVWSNWICTQLFHLTATFIV